MRPVTALFVVDKNDGIIAHAYQADTAWEKAAILLKRYRWELQESGDYRIERLTIVTESLARESGIIP